MDVLSAVSIPCTGSSPESVCSAKGDSRVCRATQHRFYFARRGTDYDAIEPVEQGPVIDENRPKPTTEEESTNRKRVKEFLRSNSEDEFGEMDYPKKAKIYTPLRRSTVEKHAEELIAWR
uniref:Uncharacterized protein n=1 Tax=Ditylenchus dipsaci TaxID=166011 RepID=A0A915D6C3_9BILA